MPFFDESVGAYVDGLMGHPFVLVLGRRTCDVSAGSWPTAGAEEGAQPLDDAVEHVASRGSSMSSTVVVMVRYRAAGQPRTGSFGS